MSKHFSPTSEVKMPHGQTAGMNPARQQMRGVEGQRKCPALAPFINLPRHNLAYMMPEIRFHQN